MYEGLCEMLTIALKTVAMGLSSADNRPDTISYERGKGKGAGMDGRLVER